MDISSGLIAKGTAGALAAAATTAGVIYKDQLFGKDRSHESTQFDNGLINFLNGGGDIIFEVKKGDESEDLTADTAFTFDSTNKTLSLTAKVTVNTNNSANLIENNKAKDGDKGKISILQKINKKVGNEAGADWIWTCEIKFEAKDIESSENKSMHNKDKLLKSNGEGLFGVLKKTSGKDAKKKFIKFCAKERGAEKNNAINATGIPEEDSNNLKSETTIKLKLGVENDPNGQTDTNTLYPVNRNIFGKLLGEEKEETASLPTQYKI